MLREAMDELALVSPKEFKSRHDDFIDTVSMLAVIGAWRPSKQFDDPKRCGETDIWEWEDDSDSGSAVDSYIV